MKKVELLAPAGSKEALEAAVKAGADAIYLAGQQFGARKSAANFSEEALIEAIQYCHVRNVKVFMTVNTLLRDEEMATLEAYLRPYYMAGIDAFIVQDLGVFHFLKQTFPEVDLHVSTQMTIANVEDAKVLKKMGATRIVVPREMTLEEISTIKSEAAIEIEAFVHGALCVSVSGQCLMSSLIGQRSGNRGACAQSCRQKYQLIKEDGNSSESVVSKDGDYLLSPKDLMTLHQLKSIIDSGVYSLKIEGRMKGPEYTYAVTRAYRMAIDAIENRGEEKESLAPLENDMKRIFNRDFTDGFILETSNKAFISQETPGNRGILVAKVESYDKRNQEVVLNLIEDISKGDDLQVRTKGNVGARVEYIKKNNQRTDRAQKGERIIVNFKHELASGELVYRTYDQTLMKDIQMTLNDEETVQWISAKVNLNIGQPMTLELWTEAGLKVVVSSEEIVEKAIKAPLDDLRLKEQIEKTGGTGLSIKNIEILRDEQATLPIRVVNQLRREGIEKLASEICQQFQRSLPEIRTHEDTAVAITRQEMSLSAYVRTLEQLDAALSLGIKKIYLHDLWQWEGLLWETLKAHLVENEEVQWIPYLGRYLTNQMLEERLKKLQLFKETLGIEQVLVGSIGAANRAKALGFTPQVDFSLNLFNHHSVLLLENMGIENFTYSVELNAEQLENFNKHLEPSQRKGTIWGYGYLPVMVSKYCPINGVYAKEKVGCQLCRKNEYYLEDKTGAKFLVKGDCDCQVEIFNSTCHNLADEWENLCELGVSEYRLNFVNESREKTVEIIEMHLKASLGYPVNTKGFGFTKGHFRRGVE